MEENFLLDLVSCLEQSKSQKRVNSDLKQLEKTINMLRLTATLAQGSSKKEINAYIKQLSAQLSTIKLKAEIDSKNIKTDINKALNNVSFKDIDALNIDENKTKIKIQKVIADARAYVEKNPISIGINFDSKRSKLDNDLTAYLNKNTKINESSVLLKEANKVRDLIDVIADKKSLTEATDAFRLFKSEVAATGYTSKSTADKVKSMLSHITKIGSAFGVASMLINNFTKSLKTLQSNDTILTEISKTSELTKRQLQELGDEAFNVASKFGQVSSNYLLAVQEMARSGYEETSKELGELSLLAQSAGDMTAENADNYLLATDAAYKYSGSVEKLNAALDGANYISNRNSASLTDIADATRVSASFAANAGVAIDELTAAEATMIATTKRSGSEIGRSFRSIILNLQQVSGEFDGEVIDEEQLKKVEERCHSLGVELEYMKDGIATLRNPMEVLKDLAEVYNSLPDNSAEKQGLISDLGGKYHANALSALLSRWDLYEKMLSEFSQGAGSALEEAEKTANSWEGRLNSLQNSWDSFINTLTDKEAVMGGISFFDRLIQGAEKLTNTIGEIPVVLTTLSTAMVATKKNYGITKVWDKETQKIDIEGNVFGIDISKIKNLKKHYEDATIAISDWNCELANGKTNLDIFENACVKNSASLKDYLSTCSKDAPASLNGYKNYLQQTGQATEDLRLKTILLNTALTMLGSLAVQAVITGIVQAFDKFNETVVESKEKVDGINSTISDLKSQLEELNNLEYKSDFDKQKIQQLERELALQEKILEIEQKRLYQNQIGTKFSDYFDADSLVTKQQAEYDHNNKNNYANLSKGYNTYKSSLEDVNAELDSLQEKLNSEELTGHDRFVAEGKIAELTEKRNTLLGKQQTIEDQLTLNMGEYLQNYQTAQEAVDSGLLTGSDLEKAESMAEYWQQMYHDSAETVANIQKMNGTYDDTNEQLEKKFGNISRDDLASLSDDDKRIALSFDPDNIIGFEELQQKIAETKGDIVDLNQTEISTFEEAWANSFTAENDAVKELGDTLLGLAEKGRLTKETFNEADSNAGGYFKNLGISADEAVSKINALVDEAKQLSSMSSQISSMADALSTKREDGFVSADTLAGFDVEVRGLESWDRFQSVLGSTTSSYKECQEAANALATEWINSSDFLAQLTDENEEYYKTQLKAMGIENYEEIIGYAHALNEAKEVLSQSSLELGNVTQDEVEALIAEGQYSELTANMILALYDAKIAEQGVSLDTAADCENLIALAGDTDRTSQSVQLLIQLMEIYNGLESGTYDNNEIARGMALAKVVAIKAQLEALAKVVAIKAQLEALANGEVKDMEIEPTVKLGNRGKSSAKSAGKKAGDAYKEGLKEALSDMESVISGVTGRIDDQISSVNAEKEAALDSISEQKEAIESAKDVAVSALEEERQKRLDVIEAQRKQIEQTIKSKQKVIDDINAEIKAMQDANAQRQRELELSKAKYELERKEQQRVKLVYTKDKGFVYKNDESGVRDAREQVRQIELEIEIANKEKEISLIEKEIDLLEDKLDLLSEQEDEINDYYDKLISDTEAFYDSQLKNLEKQRKETEKYYESITKGLEAQKSKFQELTELLEKAELSAKLKQLGIDEEALLNGSEEEFEKLKNAYLDIVYQLNAGNDDVLSKLRELSGYEGTAPTMLSDSNTELDEMNTKLGTSNTNVGNVNSSLDKTASTTSTVATNVGEISSNISESTGLVTEEQTAFSNLKQIIDTVIEAINQKTHAIEAEQNAVGIAAGSEMANFELLKNKILEVKETLDTVNDTVTTMDRQPIDNLTNAFQLLYDQIVLVSNELSVNVENSIASSIQALNDISLEEGIIAQFTNLKTAIDSVTAAISGGGGESYGGEGPGSSGSKQGGESGGKSSKGESSGGNSLTGAITEMGNTAAEVIGEPDAEGDGTVIGEFGSMETAVNDVRDAIGTEGSEGQGGNSGGEGDDTLVGSIEYLGDKTEEEMGESGGDGIIGRFEEFEGVVGDAEEHIQGINHGLDEIDGKEVSCTIKINIIRTESGGGGGAGASEGEAALLGSMNLESGTYNAKYTGNAHVSGTANVTGNWGVRKPGKTLVGELGQEIWVHSAEGTFETVGDNGPEWIRTEKNDLIFNHLQTKELLSKKNIVKTGNAYANGSAQYSDGTIVRLNGDVITPYDPDKDDSSFAKLYKAWHGYYDNIDKNVEDISRHIAMEHNQKMNKEVDQFINNASSVVNNTRNIQQPVTIHQNVTLSCPNVTNNSGVEYIQKELNGLGLKAMQVPLNKNL